MSAVDAFSVKKDGLGPSDPIGLESPVLSGGFDPGQIDRTPKELGPDTSMPDTRLGLRNEARIAAFHAKRDKTLLDGDKSII